MSPLKAIKAYCAVCTGGSGVKVTKAQQECAINDCKLHEFRLGKNPNRKATPGRIFTEEEKALAKERLAKARENRKSA